MALHSYITPSTFCGAGSMVGGAAGNWDPPPPPPPAEAFHYLRPGGEDGYLRPGGVDTYIRP